MTAETRYISQKETNGLIRSALRDAFPGVRFSVSGSGGNATTVGWTDGPDEKAVEEVARRFEGASFDGMQDLESPRYDLVDGVRVHYGASYVFTRRSYSDAVREQAEEILADAGIDPHGLNTLGEIPRSIADAYPEAERLTWQGYPADGPILARILSSAIAARRYAEAVSA
jgi:hypothetical protein